MVQAHKQSEREKRLAEDMEYEVDGDAAMRVEVMVVMMVVHCVVSMKWRRCDHHPVIAVTCPTRDECVM